MNASLVVTLFATSALAAGRTSLVGSKHDLSPSGPGPIKSTRPVDPCAFCHMTHGGGKKLTSRPDPTAEYRPYESGTLKKRAGAPTGTSRLCLSCHDGTIAVGTTLSRSIEVSGGDGNGRIPSTRRSNLGTDLRRSHPISIGGGPSPGVHPPASRGRVHLDDAGRVQCTTCHDPHSEFGGAPEGQFLVETTRGSSLCVTCHDAQSGSSHANSAAVSLVSNGLASAFTSVADIGCRACHRSHGANPKGANLALDDDSGDDAVCLRCHSGDGSKFNLANELAKPYSHALNGNLHDASEGPTSQAHKLPERSAGDPRHVTCVDCHDPHQATSAQSAPGALNGTLRGAWGIDASGARVDGVQFEYQVCFKCHGDSPNKRSALDRPFSAPRRANSDPNLRRSFSPSSASFHPVLAPGRGSDVPSLLAPWTTASTVKCSDCHSSDSGSQAGGAAPRGPHGSIHAPLLERNYSTADFTAESPAAYALCYKCHGRDDLLSERSPFKLSSQPKSGVTPYLHRLHVVDLASPCSACHAAHSVSGPAASTVTNAHLIDFDLSIVQPQGGQVRYESSGLRSGSCTLRCHGEAHDRRPYY